MNDQPPVLECRDLGKVYYDAGQPLRILNKVDFSLHRGASAAVVGVSGAGKSTLLHLLGGLDRPTEGEVLIQGRGLRRMRGSQLSRLRNQCLGFVYQFHHLLPEFSALENVAMPLLIARVARRESLRRAAHLLERLGLAERGAHRPSELSGGERQRVAIARAMANHPACILADEPTGNLDSQTAEQVFQLLLGAVREEGIALLVVTHDVLLAERMDRVFALDGVLRLREG